MDIRKLQRAIVDGLEDVKAQNIVVFNTEHLSSMFERVIIASGTSNRQTKALASSVRESVRSGGMQVMATEGEDNGEWIIVDCGAAVAHIMQPAIREYYHLEEIWGGKNVKIKLGDTTTRLVKASEPEPKQAPRRSAASKSAAAKKAPAKYAVPDKVAAKKPKAKQAPASTQQAPAKKAAAKKATVKKATSTIVVATRAPAKKAATKTAARAPARKAAAKPAVKKTPARSR